MYYKIIINETSSRSTNQEKRTFNQVVATASTPEELKQFFIDRYGKIPSQRKKVYVDTPEGAKVVGFTYSYWNQDMSHMSNKWHQQDWISVKKVEETTVLLNDIIAK